MKRAEAHKETIRREMTPPFQPQLLATTYDFKQPTAEDILQDAVGEELGKSEDQGKVGQTQARSIRRPRPAQSQTQTQVRASMVQPAMPSSGVTRSTYAVPNYPQVRPWRY